MTPAPGSRVDHYEIIELIGKGGMGEVYRAKDTRLPRDVAIKVSTQQFSERFAREAKIIASLSALRDKYAPAPPRKHGNIPV